MLKTNAISYHRFLSFVHWLLTKCSRVFRLFGLSEERSSLLPDSLGPFLQQAHLFYNGVRNMRNQSLSCWARLFAILALVIVVVPLQVSASQESLTAPIESAVLKQLAAEGQATYWVILKEQADLSGASQIADRNARGQYVYDQLTSFAEGTQSGLDSLLAKSGAQYTRYWIVNAIYVTSGEAVLNEVSRQPEVKEIVAPVTFAIPEPTPGIEQAKINAVEWNVARINAPQVWSTYGDTGQGIVVANIDTGVQYDHPALVGKYRGNLGGGVFNHNYNWFDPSQVCGTPSLVPCDNYGHGTHTMGTMVGDDGGANQIGVAPGARFIMAKGCESNSCSDTALLASAQWVLAPTDLNGANPRPDLRPHVVNNSWGSTYGGDPWYRAMVQAWVASGIFPAFSIGNNGAEGCNTAGSPGDYPESYASGAFDIGNAIAYFSSRGPSAFGGIKPNISAPGVDVRSSVPTGSYDSYQGTSMASPHVAATVALIWAAAPVLMGDIAQTTLILNQTAIDTSDLSCGGVAENNNVWGQGRLDAFAAVTQSPMGPVGALQGTVTDAGTGLPIANAAVQAVGPITRNTTTDANGFYSFPALSPGSYNVTVSKFGYLPQTVSGVLVADGDTTIQDFAMTPAPSYSVSGYVRDQDLQPIANATVMILITPIPPATTDAAGFYSFPSVPTGTTYNVSASAGRCNDPQTRQLVLSGDVTDFDFVLPLRTDAFGYYCQVQPPAYIEANTVLPLTGDDNSLQVSLPFNFPLYGTDYSSAFVCTNGFLNFLAANSVYNNGNIPSTGTPNGAIYPFWDDLYVDASASVRTEVLGSPNRFVIEWRNVRPYGDTTRRMDLEVVLYEGGQILTQYRNIANDGREKGNSATLGIENESGTIAFRYSYNEAVIADPEFAVMYQLPPSAFVEGYVTDFNDRLPIVGATVKALQSGSTVRQVTTDANGFYRFQVRLGVYDVEASMTNYGTETAMLTLAIEDATYTQNFALKTPRGEVFPTSLEFLVPVGQSRTKTLTLSNTGSLDMTFNIREIGGGPITASATVASEKTLDYDPNAFTTEDLNVGGVLSRAASPEAPGDVLKSWTPAGMTVPWGVGFDGDVWLSDPASSPILSGKAFDVNGNALGPSYDCPYGGAWCGDMAYDTSNGWMCSVNVGGDNGIYCWDPATGATVGSITGAFPWTVISQRGLAYRPDDDSFYIGGWNQGILYHVAGFSHATPGAVLDQCTPPDGGISGLAWNPGYKVVWEATNTPTDTIYQLTPTCAVLDTLAHPSPGYSGGGLEMDDVGNLWMVSQATKMVYLMDSGLPSFVDVPWLSEAPTSGTVPVGGAVQIQVMVNTTGLAPGVYEAMIVIQTNSRRQPNLSVPVRLIVPAYFVGVNAADGAYTDTQGETWYADKLYAAGSWGYINKSSRPGKSTKPIAGTNDDKLYQTFRQSPTEYRFDGLVAGTYEVDLRFAELDKRASGTRIFDVIAELNNTLLPAHDITYEVGSFTADNHVFYVTVTDGQLNLRFVERRGYAPPVVSAIRVIHRPDK